VLVVAGITPARKDTGRPAGGHLKDETDLACTGCCRQEIYKQAPILDSPTPSIAVLWMLRRTFHVLFNLAGVREAGGAALRRVLLQCGRADDGAARHGAPLAGACPTF